jgi:hypothetical protein
VKTPGQGCVIVCDCVCVYVYVRGRVGAWMGVHACVSLSYSKYADQRWSAEIKKLKEGKKNTKNKYLGESTGRYRSCW